jgi:hypothetical protein
MSWPMPVVADGHAGVALHVPEVGELAVGHYHVLVQRRCVRVDGLQRPHAADACHRQGQHTEQDR